MLFFNDKSAEKNVCIRVLATVFSTLKQKLKYTNSHHNYPNHRAKISKHKQILLKTTCLRMLFHELHMKLGNFLRFVDVGFSVEAVRL